MKKFVNIFALIFCFMFSGFAMAKDASDEIKYLKKVQVNDETIVTIAGVINYVCPKLVKNASKLCNKKDPVGSAVAFQKQLLGKGTIEDLDDLDDDDLKKTLKKRKILHKEGAMQFYDAVEQFKKHFAPRKKAKAFALKSKWKEASLHEEMAWQYLVKCASRGIFAKKMVDGE
ncbi:MAG: hypothetical protein DRQ88_00470 [Epsilonproteobacteria bacterium]|nr:MAG: hypothetical protein DRQ89_03550 [Campylobacterota bacterium]RLA68110.1 MAG: hypothetical protein DRQ88_00470 [Campylobacterota bacterium]